jgi:unsaturated chondroitin disaccharide hydrolase
MYPLEVFLMNHPLFSESAAASLLLLALAGVTRADALLDSAIADAWNLAETKTAATIDYLKATYPTNYLVRYPTETAANGQWNTADANTSKGWVSGFYPGTLWLLYQRTGDPQWFQYAKDWTAGIEAVKNNPLDHDLGFRFTCSFYNGYKLGHDANDPTGLYRAAARENLTTAAGTLDTLFNKGDIPVGAIKCLDGWVEPYPVIVDTMVNITLLFAAWDLSGRPASGPARTWYSHAVTHANTTIAQNLRTSASSDPLSRRDGSTYHCVNHNDGTGGRPANGAVFQKRTIQGYSNETTWSRGQAWALYGFTETYRHTRDDPSVTPQNFLNAARSLADYFIARLPNNHTADRFNHVVGDFIPPSDFDAALGEPAGPWSNGRAGTRTYTLRDSSAAAIAASGLLQLSVLDTDPALGNTWFLAAENIIRSLLTFKGSDNSLDYLGRNSQHMGILIGGSKLWGDTQRSLIYGDYYLLEALTRYEAIRDSNNPPSPFDSWLRQYFTVAELSDSGLVGDHADPDGDSIPNLIECALDLNPRVAHAHPEALPKIQPVTGGDGTTLEFTYPRRLDMPDLLYGVETATNLTDWTSVPDERVSAQAQIEKRRAVFAAGETVRFVRLKIVRGN